MPTVYSKRAHIIINKKYTFSPFYGKTRQALNFYNCMMTKNITAIYITYIATFCMNKNGHFTIAAKSMGNA